VFLTLEDETGLSQAIIRPDLFRNERSTILGHHGLIVEGIVQNQEGQEQRDSLPPRRAPRGFASPIISVRIPCISAKSARSQTFEREPSAVS
jgi:hypothetical protein